VCEDAMMPENPKQMVITSLFCFHCVRNRRNYSHKKYDYHHGAAFYETSKRISYSLEDVSSLKVKLEHAKNRGLAGASVWYMEDDDFNGDCVFSKNVAFPLLKKVKEVFDDLTSN